MQCPECQHENPDDAKFCNECGHKLELACPECEKVNPPGSRFCNECGHSLSLLSKAKPKDLSFDRKIDTIQRYLPHDLSEKILSQRDKIKGECKQLIIMFCDMVGFTSLVENVDLEEAYSIMDQVYEMLIHEVHDYEGTVNEMTGDGISALFGAPNCIGRRSSTCDPLSYSIFLGSEFRWNLTEEFSPFDIWFAKGIRTNVQIAFFAEQAILQILKRTWAKSGSTRTGRGPTGRCYRSRRTLNPIIPQLSMGAV